MLQIKTLSQWRMTLMGLTVHFGYSWGSEFEDTSVETSNNEKWREQLMGKKQKQTSNKKKKTRTEFLMTKRQIKKL